MEFQTWTFPAAFGTIQVKARLKEGHLETRPAQFDPVVMGEVHGDSSLAISPSALGGACRINH